MKYKKESKRANGNQICPTQKDSNNHEGIKEEESSDDNTKVQQINLSKLSMTNMANI